MVRYTTDDHVADVAGTHFLKIGRGDKKGIDLALDEELHRVKRYARDPMDVLVRIEPDRSDHDPYQQLVIKIGTSRHTESSVFKVCHGSDVVPAEHLKASEMQTGQEGDRRASFHCHDERRRKCPAKVHLAMRQHIADCS